MASAGPALRFAVHEDGSLEVLTAWFPLVEFADVDLAFVGRGLRVDADLLTVRCRNGGAVYRLGSSERGVRPARLVRAWGGFAPC